MLLTILSLALPVTAGLLGWGFRYAVLGGFVMALLMLWGSNMKRDIWDRLMGRSAPGLGYWFLIAPIGLVLGTAAGCLISVPAYLIAAWVHGNL
jgi:hypothetical protein